MKTIIEPYFDPLSLWLVRKLRFDRPFVSMGVGFVIGLCGYIVSPAINGVLLPTEGYISSLEAWPLSYVWLVAIPLVFGYYFSWQSSNADQTLLSLVNDNVLDASKEIIASSVKKQWLEYTNKPWWILAVVLALAGTILHVRDSISYPIATQIWYTVDLTSFYLSRVPAVFLGLFMVAQILIRHFGFIFLLKKIFKEFNVKIYVLHPDRAGGLGNLGKHSLFMATFLSVIALNIAAVNVAVNLIYQARSTLVEPSMVILMVAYLVISPLVFFLPLSIVHKEMKLAKNQALYDISVRARELFERSQQLIPNDTSIKKLSDELRSLKELHELGSKFPVWPFDADTVGKFFITVIIPFVPSILIEVALRLLFGN